LTLTAYLVPWAFLFAVGVTMGRKSKLTDEKARELAEAILNARSNEQAATTMLEMWLAFGQLHRVLKTAPIARHRFEFRVEGGRIDLLLFHIDGGLSIVEAKAENQPVIVAGGIGQLCMYAALLPAALGRMNPAYINRILVAPLAPEKCIDLLKACELAGVRFCALPQFSILKSQADALRQDYGTEIIPNP
jgi:hypothetical protein